MLSELKTVPDSTRNLVAGSLEVCGPLAPEVRRRFFRTRTADTRFCRFRVAGSGKQPRAPIFAGAARGACKRDSLIQAMPRTSARGCYPASISSSN